MKKIEIMQKTALLLNNNCSNKLAKRLYSLKALKPHEHFKMKISSIQSELTET